MGPVKGQFNEGVAKRQPTNCETPIRGSFVKKTSASLRFHRMERLRHRHKVTEDQAAAPPRTSARENRSFARSFAGYGASLKAQCVARALLVELRK